MGNEECEATRDRCREAYRKYTWTSCFQAIPRVTGLSESRRSIVVELQALYGRKLQTTFESREHPSEEKMSWDSLTGTSTAGEFTIFPGFGLVGGISFCMTRRKIVAVLGMHGEQGYGVAWCDVWRYRSWIVIQHRHKLSVPTEVGTKRGRQSMINEVCNCLYCNMFRPCRRVT